MDSIHKSVRKFFVERKPSNVSLLIACSGGPDSVALVRILKELSSEFPLRFHIGHVNHELRGKDSDGDAVFVKKLAADVDWPCHISIKSMKSLKKGNLEEETRVERYDALFQMSAQTKTAAILTAHTLDDHAETILMNLLRGTGPDGLAGIHAAREWKNSGVQLWRPFLEVSKQDVLTYLKSHRIRFRKDKSNQDQKFFRNWLRRTIVPRLESRAPGFQKRLFNLSLLMRDELDFWEGNLNEIEKEILKPASPGHFLDFHRLLRYPSAVQRRFLRRVVGRDLLTFEGVENLRQWMMSPPTAGRFWQMRKGWVAERLSKSKGSPSAKIFWFKANSK